MVTHVAKYIGTTVFEILKGGSKTFNELWKEYTKKTGLSGERQRKGLQYFLAEAVDKGRIKRDGGRYKTSAIGSKRAALDRIASLTSEVRKLSGAYGTDPMPYADLMPLQFTVWVTFARFGRPHHVTGNINRLEKKLQKIQSKIQANLKDDGIKTDGMAEIYVGDTKQKQVSIISFTIKPMRGTEFIVEKAAGAAWGIGGWKAPPWG